MDSKDIKKNTNFLMTIEDLSSKGEGIGRINNFTVFVEGRFQKMR